MPEQYRRLALAPRWLWLFVSAAVNPRVKLIELAEVHVTGALLP
jgi:hypothetical protein